jgi:Zn-finger nucleic acid-binding protein
MKCPHCQVDLQMTERQGIEVDYCPNCRGVWLDRGELDKIIERSATSAGSAAPPRQPADRERDYDSDYRGRKKKSFLSELFDFG